MRPRKIGADDDVSGWRVSCMEHTRDVYRLYTYGPGEGGFLKDGQIVCSSIPKGDENGRLSGLLLYNQDDYDKARKEWRSFWEWMSTRNDSRWIGQDSGALDFDAKNMVHTIRPLVSVEHLFLHGEPLVRPDGSLRTFLMDIRLGKYTYDYLLGYAEEKLAILKEMYERSQLPAGANQGDVVALYSELVRMPL